MGLFVEMLEAVAYPLAQGIWASLPYVAESAPDALKSALLSRIKEHFRSTREVARALEAAMDQALRSIEVALAGPWLLTKTGRKEFAVDFEQAVLLPLAQERGLSAAALEEFRKKSAKGCKLAKRQWRVLLEAETVTEEQLPGCRGLQTSLMSCTDWRNRR